MVGLVLVGVVVLVLAAWAADRLYKARVLARRRTRMTTRLAAATERTDRQLDEREAAAAAGAALTSFIPAIGHPGPTVPGTAPHGPRSRVGRKRPAPREQRTAREHGTARETRRTGEHGVRTGEHPIVAGEQPIRSGEHKTGAGARPAPPADAALD